MNELIKKACIMLALMFPFAIFAGGHANHGSGGDHDRIDQHHMENEMHSGKKYMDENKDKIHKKMDGEIKEHHNDMHKMKDGLHDKMDHSK